MKLCLGDPLCNPISGEGEIRCIQLEMVTKWIAEFQAANKQPDEDVVFDVLCGDFNFDNCSPGVLLSHARLYSVNIFPFC